MSSQRNMSFAANMYLYLFEGSVICVSNSILLWCILSDARNRRRREFILVAAQAIADLCYAVAFMLIADRRLNLYFNDLLTAMIPATECSFTAALWLHNLATPLLGLLPLTTSFNFFLCSVTPVWYLSAGFTYTFGLISAPFSMATLLLVANAVLQWNAVAPTSALCIAANGAANVVAYHIMLFFRLAANLASAVIYAFILIYLRRSQGGSLKTLSAQQQKMHRNAKITLGMVTLNSMLLLFIPDVLLAFNPLGVVQKYSTPLYSMTLSKTMINFVIYMARYRELRNIILCRIFACMPEWANRRCSVFLYSVAGLDADEVSRINGRPSFGARSRSSNAVAPERRSSVAPKRSTVLPPRTPSTPKIVVDQNDEPVDPKLSITFASQTPSTPRRLPPITYPPSKPN